MEVAGHMDVSRLEGEATVCAGCACWWSTHLSEARRPGEDSEHKSVA